MNITFNLKLEKLNDLTDQVFDYFNLAYYDLESRIDSKLNLNYSSKIQIIFVTIVGFFFGGGRVNKFIKV